MGGASGALPGASVLPQQSRLSLGQRMPLPELPNQMHLVRTLDCVGSGIDWADGWRTDKSV